MDYKKLEVYKNNENSFAESLGLEYTKIEEGYAEGKIKIMPQFLNYVGILHGGFIFTVADAVCGAAAVSYGYKVVTVNADIEFLKAGENVDTVYAVARVINHGRKLSRFYVEVMNDYREVLASGIFTYYSQLIPLGELEKQ